MLFNFTNIFFIMNSLKDINCIIFPVRINRVFHIRKRINYLRLFIIYLSLPVPNAHSQLQFLNRCSNPKRQ